MSRQSYYARHNNGGGLPLRGPATNQKAPCLSSRIGDGVDNRAVTFPYAGTMWQQWTDFLANSFALSQQNVGWMTQAFLIVLATLILSFVASFLLRRLEARLDRTRTLWDDALVAAIRKPACALIWVIGIGFAAETIHAETEAPLLPFIPQIGEVLFIVIVGWALMRFTRKGAETVVEQQRRRGKRVDLTTVDAISNLLKASIVITTGLIILQALGYSINAVLTFGGIGGIAVGFAAKDLLANFFGAMMIYLDRPFNVGDWVRSPDQEIEGTVEKIGWRMTTIRTFDKRPLYVPNAIFAQISVENPSRMSHRRIYETIGVRYDDIEKIQAITDAVRQMLKEHEAIDDSQTMIVHFNAFNASSCDFFVYTFTHTTEWVKFHAIKQDVLLKIAAIIAEHKAEIAYPTQTLHLPDVEAALQKTG